MSYLILGLILFLGMHSARIFGEGARSAFIAQRGAGAWKGLYSVVSVVGFGLIVWGYGQARLSPIPLWTPPPVGVRHAVSLLVLLAFILLAASYVPGNIIKAKVHHPMVLGVKTWAFAHLIVNHTLADLLLFGGFLVWAVLNFRASRARDRREGTSYPPGRAVPTVIAVVLGAVLWFAFFRWAHLAWIGVSPL